jgi:hypothetical protein
MQCFKNKLQITEVCVISEDTKQAVMGEIEVGQTVYRENRVF